MTEKEFNVALAKGQGRAIQHLRSVDPSPLYHSVRRAVLRWQGYDAQCEDRRGEYLLDLIDASSDPEGLKALVIRHLARKKGRRSQKLDIVKYIALRGSKEARQAIYDAFDPTTLFADDEILEIDGLEGLGFLLSRADEIPEEKREQWGWWVHDLSKRLGEEQVIGFLESSKLCAAQEALELYRELENGTRGPTRTEDQRTYAEVKAQWLEKPSRFHFRFWSGRANRAELAAAAEDLESSDDPELLLALGHALRGRASVSYAYIGNLDRLIERAKAWNATDHRNPFVFAVEECRSEKLRDLAHWFLSEGRIEWAFSLYEANAQREDAPRLIEATSGIDTDDRELVHAITHDCLNTAKRMDDAVASEILGWLYEHSWCSFCRESTVRDMLDRGLAPQEILAEATLDAVPDTRKLARSALLIDSGSTTPDAGSSAW